MSFLQLVFSLDKMFEGNNSILENMSILTDIATVGKGNKLLVTQNRSIIFVEILGSAYLLSRLDIYKHLSYKIRNPSTLPTIVCLSVFNKRKLVLRQDSKLITFLNPKKGIFENKR